MKEKIKKNNKIIILTISIIIFLLILKDVFYYEITYYDEWAYSVFVEDLRSDPMTIIMKFFTFLGSAPCLIIILLLMFLFLRKKEYPVIATLNILIIFLINNIIKFIVQRPRPSGYNIITESNYSFPSGHSMVSTAFYGFIIYLIYKKIKDKKVKYLLISILFLIIIAICISRIYLGVHYLSDTLAGFSLSVAYLMLFITFLPKILKKEKKDSNEKEKN